MLKDVLVKYPADFIIRGEGEESFKELLLSIKNRSITALLKVLPIGLKDKLSKMEDRELISNLDIIPFPIRTNWTTIKIKLYIMKPPGGCPFNCAYCSSSTTKGVRYFSLERVKKTYHI